MFDYVMLLLEIQNATGDEYNLIVRDYLGEENLISGNVSDIFDVLYGYLLNHFRVDNIKKVNTFNDDVKNKKNNYNIFGGVI